MLATFFTQITFLNMIISIMSDVYEEVKQGENIFSLQIKLQMVADYSPIIKNVKDPFLDGRRYLYVVTPNEEVHDADEDWNGQLNMLKSHVQKTNDRL